jgi:uncharacterized protein YndB with AHSA1/START domain
MTDWSQCSISIRSTPERVFAALTRSEQLEAWFAEFAEINIEERRFDFWGRHTPGNPPSSEGRHKLTAFEPGSKLAFQWNLAGVDSTVEIAVRPDGEETLLSLRHSSTADASGPDLLVDFWSTLVLLLRGWLEDGTVPWRPDYSIASLPEIRLSLHAKAPVEGVWAALTEAEQLNRWIAEDATIDLEPGGEFDFGWPNEWGRPLKVLDLAAPNRLELSWADGPGETSVVTWELEGSDGGTRITLVHNGFAEAVSQDEYYMGWADFVVRLKYMVEEPARWRWRGSRGVQQQSA